MALSHKACNNILRLLHTQDSRNGELALRLLNSQQSAADFLLSLCAHFLTSRNEQRIFLRNCLRTLIKLLAVSRGIHIRDTNQLMGLLNYDPAQNKEQLETHLLQLQATLNIDVLLLARFIFSRTGQCGGFVLSRSSSQEKLAILECRTHRGPWGKTLGLDHLALEELPGEILQIDGLRAIGLSHNQLQKLPPWLSKYSGLRYINLRHNSFQAVPDGLRRLRGLEQVDLRDNLCSLPYLEFFQHPLRGKLKAELIEGEGFTLGQFHDEDILLALQNWIYEIDGGQALNLSGRNLRSVPQCLSAFPHLRMLDLRDNAIGQLPTWLLKIPNIHHIYCDWGTYYNPASAHDKLEVLRDQEAKLPEEKKAPAGPLFTTPQLPVHLPIEFDLSNVLATP